MALTTLTNGLKTAAGATGDGGVALNDNFTALDAVKGKVDALNSAPTTVADATERKAISGGVVGVTRIIQSNLPGILWNLVAADATLDASWIGLPYTVDPDGEVVVSMKLANATGTVPDANVIGTSGGTLRIGDGVTENGRSVAMRVQPRGMARFVSVNTSSVVVLCKSTTGYVAARSWDGTVTVFGSGTPASSINASLSVPASGAWSKSAPKMIYVWSCTSGDATRSGDLTYLSTNPVAEPKVFSADVSGLDSVIGLLLDSKSSTASDPLQTLDLSGMPALEVLDISRNALTQIDTVDNPALTSFTSINTPLFGEIDFTVNPLLEFVSLDGSSATSVDLSGLTALTELSLFLNSNLTGVRAVGVSLTATSSLASSNLDAGALNQFYTDLAAGTATIDVNGNPGTAGHDPSIATAKGYTITV